MQQLDPYDPRTVGTYRITGKLGEGGMGKVYQGRSPGGRLVAVKLARPELADDPGFRARFRSEIAAARRVGGFHTAQVVDADPDARPPWMVTAFVPGRALDLMVAEDGPLAEPELRALGAALAEALGAVHDCGLVHRDFKPSNIIMSDDGPRVVDFGIARALHETRLTTATQMVVGTPGFLAPEQIGGGEIGSWTDVFALGAVLVHAAGGQAFGGGNPMAMMYKAVHEAPDLSAVPADLRPLVTSCLDKDPAVRPSPQALLTAFAGRLPTAVQTPAPTVRSEEPAVVTRRASATTPDRRHRPVVPGKLVLTSGKALGVKFAVVVAIPLLALCGFLVHGTIGVWRPFLPFVVGAVSLTLVTFVLRSVMRSTTYTVTLDGNGITLARNRGKYSHTVHWSEVAAVGKIVRDGPRLWLPLMLTAGAGYPPALFATLSRQPDQFDVLLPQEVVEQEPGPSPVRLSAAGQERRVSEAVRGLAPWLFDGSGAPAQQAGTGAPAQGAPLVLTISRTQRATEAIGAAMGLALGAGLLYVLAVHADQGTLTVPMWIAGIVFTLYCLARLGSSVGEGHTLTVDHRGLTVADTPAPTSLNAVTLAWSDIASISRPDGLDNHRKVLVRLNAGVPLPAQGTGRKPVAPDGLILTVPSDYPQPPSSRRTDLSRGILRFAPPHVHTNFL